MTAQAFPAFRATAAQEQAALNRVRSARRELRAAETEWRAACASTADVGVALLAARAAQARRARRNLFARLLDLVR